MGPGKSSRDILRDAERNFTTELDYGSFDSDRLEALADDFVEAQERLTDAEIDRMIERARGEA